MTGALKNRGNLDRDRYTGRRPHDGEGRNEVMLLQAKNAVASKLQEARQEA